MMAPAARRRLNTPASIGTIDFKRLNDPAVVFKPARREDLIQTMSKCRCSSLTFGSYGGNIVLEKHRYTMKKTTRPLLQSLSIQGSCLFQSRGIGFKHSSQSRAFQVHLVNACKISLSQNQVSDIVSARTQGKIQP